MEEHDNSIAGPFLHLTPPPPGTRSSALLNGQSADRLSCTTGIAAAPLTQPRIPSSASPARPKTPSHRKYRREFPSPGSSEAPSVPPATLQGYPNPCIVTQYKGCPSKCGYTRSTALARVPPSDTTHAAPRLVGLVGWRWSRLASRPLTPPRSHSFRLRTIVRRRLSNLGEIPARHRHSSPNREPALGAGLVSTPSHRFCASRLAHTTARLASSLFFLVRGASPGYTNV